MIDETQVNHDPRCTICSHVRSNHGAFRHPFSDPKTPLDPSQVFGKTRAGQTGGSGRGPALSDAQFARADLSVSKFPFDPVLRQALLTKGILTADDLIAAESHISAVTNQIESVLGKEENK